MPCRAYLRMPDTKFDGPLRIAFQGEAPAVFRQIQQGKHLPGHLKYQCSIIEGKAFGDGWF